MFRTCTKVTRDAQNPHKAAQNLHKIDGLHKKSFVCTTLFLFCADLERTNLLKTSLLFLLDGFVQVCARGLGSYVCACMDDETVSAASVPPGAVIPTVMSAVGVEKSSWLRAAAMSKCLLPIKTVTPVFSCCSVSSS